MLERPPGGLAGDLARVNDLAELARFASVFRLVSPRQAGDSILVGATPASTTRPKTGKSVGMGISRLFTDF